VIKPPKPIIEIHGEPLFQVADFGNEVLDFNITNTLLTAWILTVMLIVICWLLTRRRSMIPSGWYNAFEAVIETIDNFISSIAGERFGRRFFPLVATLFIYIAFANWMSLFPVFNTIGGFVPLHAEEDEFHDEAVVFTGDSSVKVIGLGADFVELDAEDCATGEEGDACRQEAIDTATEEHTGDNEHLGVLFPFLRGINTDLMTPLSFAIVAMFMIQYWGISALGVRRYMSKFINFSSPINFFVGFLESIAEFAKVISFSFRLFGNMMAGEILLLVMTFLVGICAPFILVFYGLELFVGMIQAFVFGTLTLVFAVLAISAHGSEEHAEGGEHHG
jgi:F-type H+-transporting ATPase subunit a